MLKVKEIYNMGTCTNLKRAFRSPISRSAPHMHKSFPPFETPSIPMSLSLTHSCPHLIHTTCYWMRFWECTHQLQGNVDTISSQSVFDLVWWTRALLPSHGRQRMPISISTTSYQTSLVMNVWPCILQQLVILFTDYHLIIFNCFFFIGIPYLPA